MQTIELSKPSKKRNIIVMWKGIASNSIYTSAVDKNSALLFGDENTIAIFKIKYKTKCKH